MISLRQANRAIKGPLVVLACILMCTTTSAQPISTSENAIYENPRFLMGMNKATGTVSGYLTALRTEPGRTDSCKLAFVGKVNGERAKIALADVESQAPSQSTHVAELYGSGANLNLSLDAKNLPGDCGWIFEFIGPPAVQKSGQTFTVTLANGVPGDWIGVAVIDAPRSYFYDQPQEGSIRKAYLVKGDVVKVYEERPGWYFVSYKQRKKETKGWMQIKNTMSLGK